MYNDRNRQMPQPERQFPMTARGDRDIPELDGDQGGRCCDGSLDRTSYDHAERNRTGNGERCCNGSLGRTGNGRNCDETLRDRTGNGGRCCDGSLGRTARDQVSHDRTGNGGRCCDGSLDRTSYDHAAHNRMDNGKGKSWGLHEHPLAMVYSPCQQFRDIYTPDVAHGRGTLFAELDLPFEASKNKRNGGCGR